MSKDLLEDDDFLLSQLTEDEIAELSEMIDPDVSRQSKRFLLIISHLERSVAAVGKDAPSNKEETNRSLRQGSFSGIPEERGQSKIQPHL